MTETDHGQIEKQKSKMRLNISREYVCVCVSGGMASLADQVDHTRDSKDCDGCHDDSVHQCNYIYRFQVSDQRHS